MARIQQRALAQQKRPEISHPQDTLVSIVTLPDRAMGVSGSAS